MFCYNIILTIINILWALFDESNISVIGIVDKWFKYTILLITDNIYI